MFNIFKTKKAVAVKSAQVIIAEIHNEFDTSVERLLAQAKELASGYDKDEVRTLRELGFTKSANVSEMKKAEKATRAADRALYFQQYYPFQKFITIDEVERICKKYNLLCGPVFDFTGKIPKKNIAEISSFKLRQDDMVKYGCNYYNNAQSQSAYSGSNMSISLKKTNIYGYMNAWYVFNHTPEDQKIAYENRPMKICAPHTDFELHGKQVREGFMIVDDPIVLQEVEGGYLVVSKWGLEAADELLVNGKVN